MVHEAVAYSISLFWKAKPRSINLTTRTLNGAGPSPWW